MYIWPKRNNLETWNGSLRLTGPETLKGEERLLLLSHGTKKASSVWVNPVSQIHHSIHNSKKEKRNQIARTGVVSY